MKNKKILSSLVADILCVSLLPTTILSANAAPALISANNTKHIIDNGCEYTDNLDADLSAVKPAMTVTKKVFASAEEANGQIVTVNFDISGDGVDKAYASTGIHVFWDDRLTAVPDDNGEIVAFGSAFSKISCFSSTDGNGVMVVSAGDGDKGKTGTMFSIKFRLPENVKEGDIFPIDVAYQKKGSTSDLFTNSLDDKNGRLMQSWFFKNGINSASNPSDDPYLIKAGAAYADGYIAVEGNAAEESNSFISDKSSQYNQGIDANESAIKPYMNVSKVIIKNPEEAKGKSVKVDFDIAGEGVDKAYSSTGIHVFWDSRLTVIPNEDDEIVTFGDAVSRLARTSSADENGVMIATAGDKDSGMTGNMFSIKFKLPEDVKAGDVFPIDVAYQEKSFRSDLFTNSTDDYNGKLMQAWFFTNGINSSSNPSTDSYLVNAGASYADGYIVIENDAETSATTTTTTTTTTSSTTSKTTTSKTTKATTSKTTTSKTTKATTSKTTTSKTTKATTSKTTTSKTTKATTSKSTTKKTTSKVTTTTTTSAEKPSLYGDANCDGIVNIGDVVLIMQSIANPSVYGLHGSHIQHITYIGIINSDVYGDNDGLTNQDALAIQKYLLKLIISLTGLF